MLDHYTYVTLTKKSEKSTVFTCTAIRAVYLELVEDQTANALLRAFKRFASRRGIPECIISDNAKTFKAGSQDLQALKVLAEEDNLKK